jgi:hypothetical protein
MPFIEVAYRTPATPKAHLTPHRACRSCRSRRSGTGLGLDREVLGITEDHETVV